MDAIELDYCQERKYILGMDAKYLIERLKALGLTQYRIAKETGLSESTISRIARGERTGGLHSTVLKLQALVVRCGK